MCTGFIRKGKETPEVEFRYVRIDRVDKIRRGGVSTQMTVHLKDDIIYTMELDNGLRGHDYIDKHRPASETASHTRADELHRLAELRGERIQKKHHIVNRRHPNRSIGGDIGIYLLLRHCAIVYHVVDAVDEAGYFELQPVAVPAGNDFAADASPVDCISVSEIELEVVQNGS